MLRATGQQAMAETMMVSETDAVLRRSQRTGLARMLYASTVTSKISAASK